MERFVCLDCKSVGPLNIRGNCDTCGSSAVVSEESYRWPGYEEWRREAQKTLYLAAKRLGIPAIQ